MARKSNGYRKRKLHIGRVIGCLSLGIIACSGTLMSVQNYNNPSILGTWISESTGEHVTFKKNNEVVLGDVTYRANYEIVSPNHMSYTVENKHFDMYYNLEGRELRWGMEEKNLEVFKRK